MFLFKGTPSITPEGLVVRNITTNTATLSFHVVPLVPRDNITWTFLDGSGVDAIITDSEPFRRFSSDKLTLTLEPVFITQQGIYTLTAVGPSGSNSSQITAFIQRELRTIYIIIAIIIVFM